MMNFLDYLKDEFNFTTTENGAVAITSTMNACLDAFGILGASKDASDASIIKVFKSAFFEDRKIAMRILFYMRDVRGGQGMRRVFRIIIMWLANNYPEYVLNNLNNFSEFGRWDDLICLLDTDIRNDVITFIKNQLFNDIKNKENNKSISLLAKWLPSENTSSVITRHYASMIREYFGWSSKKYRKTLSDLRKYIDVVEVNMSSNNWSNIDYSKVPGKASINYSNAFDKHDSDRYINYITNTSTLNAKSLFPVDIIHKVLRLGVSPYYFNSNVDKISKKDRILLNKMWESLPNYFDGLEETGICMVDTSGSMSGTPLEVALSLGIYCADKCHGPFYNHFITFSEKPNLVELKGNDLLEKISNIRSINVWNTDIEKAFNLILDTAVKNNLSNDDIPRKLYIISDMQFDEARGEHNRFKKVNQTFMSDIRKKFEDEGYTLPSIVYWDVRSSECGMFQEKFDGENCAIVSGYSASLFKSIIDGTTYEEEIKDNKIVSKAKLDPITVMINTLNNPRYDVIWA